MDESGRTRRSARQRHQARQRRRNRQPMAIRKNATGELEPKTFVVFLNFITIFFTIVKKNARTLWIAVVPIGVLLFFFLFTAFLSGRIPPNVSILDISVGGMSFDDAVTRLETAWRQDTSVVLTSDSREWSVKPSEVGLRFDVRATVQAADRIGLAGIPFGYDIDPLLSLDGIMLHQFLQQLARDVDMAPVNTQYTWHDGRVSGIQGQDGIELDIEATLERIRQSPADLLKDEFALITRNLTPPTAHSDAFLDAAQQFVTSQFEIRAYDPFEDRYIGFITTPEILATWIEAGEYSLVAKDEPIANFVDSLNNREQSGLGMNSYLNTEEVVAAINHSLSTGSIAAEVIVRSNPTTYEVVAGDTGYGISRKTGIPFFLIEESNPDRDLSILSPGDIINLPSRDATLPLPVVASKRIIVDLESQSLVAYENGQVVFSWQISSGISEAPTSPGVYQILSHEPVAYGSSYTLCDNAGCGQWEMNWFMGIYEVVPGLVNGFHGSVLLPDGGYLGDSNVGAPYTLGCVMSHDNQAKQLYDWADEGTIVEIISNEYPPRSELAEQAIGL